MPRTTKGYWATVNPLVVHGGCHKRNREKIMKHEFKKALNETKRLLSRYKIGSDEWILVGPHAYIMHGYKVKYDRPTHFHVMIDNASVPWKLTRFEKKLPEVVPPFRSKFRKSYMHFIKKTGYDFDFIISPKPLRTYLKTDSEIVTLPSGKYFRLMSLAANEKIEHNIYSQFPPEKFDRLITYFLSIVKSAREKKDFEIAKKVRENIKKYRAIALQGAHSVTKAMKDYKTKNTLQGVSAYHGKASGSVVIVQHVDAIPKNLKNRIVVARMSSPRTAGLISRSKALITDEGGILSHAAILARELKIPCVIGTKIATKVFKDGDRVEVDATKGVIRKI